METTLAIDFGTTNSAVYIYRNGRIEPLSNLSEQGKYLFPSFVEYTPKNVITCSAAKKNIGKKNRYVVSCVKRLIGLTYKQYLDLDEKDIFGCKVIEGEDGYPYFIVDGEGRQVSCIEVASELFRTIKSNADAFCAPRRFDKAYVTVPANFKDNQISAIKSAALLAGIEVKKLITEPTAAAMSWCFDYVNMVHENEKMLVYDFGGGTFDVSFLQCYSVGRFRILDVDGDPNLGGNDVDMKLVEYVLKEYQNRCKGEFIDLSDNRVKNLLRERCEDIKIILSSEKVDSVDLSDLVNEDIEVKISRMTMTTVIKPLIKRTIDCIKHITEKKGQNAGSIKRVFVVGGSSKLAVVHEMLEKMFSRSFFPEIDPDHCVALGAMKMLLMDHQDRHDVEERIVISYGLRIKDKVLIMLKRGTTVPAQSDEEVVYNTEDYPDDIYSEIYQWEGEVLDTDEEVVKELEECTCVAQFRFKNPKPQPAGCQRMKIVFSLDVGGTLEVRCRDFDTNEEMNCTRFGALYGGK